MPARSDNLRSESRAARRCSRMNDPSSDSFMRLVTMLAFLSRLYNSCKHFKGGKSVLNRPLHVPMKKMWGNLTTKGDQSDTLCENRGRGLPDRRRIL